MSHIATVRHEQGKSRLERETQSQRQKLVKESFLAYQKRLGKALAGTGLTEAVSSAESLRRIQIVRSMLHSMGAIDRSPYYCLGSSKGATPQSRGILLHTRDQPHLGCA